MRFFENGPSISDELLIARDEGRVVFFCGAGVSRARAELPDFFCLAENVIEQLGVPSNDPARKLLIQAKCIEQLTGATGVISADRIFGLLEREFDVHDIEHAVAEALKPKDDVDLSAHRILVDLAKTPEGKVRLVTTNFDRLFDACDSTLKVWQPPRLPDPSRPVDMDGIVYLHGRTNEDYSGSEGDGFILSSSEFGRAYLSEGWATTFFKEILDRYVVVFVGYSADDPPIQYLLEGLNKIERPLNNVYAFQDGEESEAAARWRHKGVEAIAFTEFSVLWESLEAWAERAKAPQAWYQSVIELARKEPEFLQPHERGQVAHIISTDRGVRKFSQTDPPLPANWLCVFDSSRRYAKPGYGSGIDSQRPLIDPFDLYRLDSDRVPNKIDPNDYSAKREIPPNAWDGFTLNRLDRKNLQDHNYPSIQGYQPCLPSRLFVIGVWISKVADQPATVWWAATQKRLHPTIQCQIKQKLKQFPNIQPVIHQAWQYLFEIWEDMVNDLSHNSYRANVVIDESEWNSATVRNYAIISRPYLTVTPNNGGLIKPPKIEKISWVSDLIKLDVEYPDLTKTLKIPDEWLPLVIREIRKNLEHAIQLEAEIDERGFYTWFHQISPIEPDNNLKVSNVLRCPGLPDWVILFSDLFNRLIKQNFDKARQEFTAWPVDDDTIFARLRIWASGKSDLFSEVFFCQVILGLSNKAFWDAYHQRDLLVVLAKRWNHFPNKPRKEIEIRLLNGPDKWNDEETQHYEQRKAWDILDRITWLANNDCRFTFDIDSTTNKLRQIEPRWKPESALKAADTMVNAGGMGRTELKHTSLLLNLPLHSILPKAEEDFHAFVELSSERPVRAFATLTDAARINEYPEWAWRIFLCSEARKNDKPKFSALIAERISRYPDIKVSVFIDPAARWILYESKQITSQFPAYFDKVITKLINVLRHQTPECNSSIIRDNKESDWSTEEINAPAGYIAQALLNDARLDGLKVSKDFPDKWLKHLEDLLFLHGDLRRNALVIFFGRLNWFHNINPDWTEVNLLSILDENDEDDHNACWSGFLDTTGADNTNKDIAYVNQKLYLRIKPSILAIIKKRSLTNSGQYHVLAEVILVGWGTVNDETHQRLTSNDEMRSALLHADETFRSNILFKLKWRLKDNESTTSNTWPEMLPEFLQKAWPLEKTVKSPVISNHLCGLAFLNVEHFPEISKIILPLLITLNENNASSLNSVFHDGNDGFIVKNPHQFLKILDKILPDNVSIWPENTGEILEKIADTDSHLKSSEKLIELKRRWNSR
jgi:hypothetical protein